MSITAALAGNPNCGKTTMFNGLTGSSQYVGNWPGVTVEKKEGKLKGSKDVIITDLPGIYSLSPYTLEEVVTRDYLMNEKPDVIINLLDASNIERNLYLTTQLLETGIPVIIALNMIDIVKKRGETIDTAKLSKELGCRVVETSAVKGEGIKEVAEQAVALAKSKVHTLPTCRFDEKVEKTLEQIKEAASEFIPKEQSRWYAVKLFERDEKAVAGLKMSTKAGEAVERIIASCENLMDDDCESIISNERYNYVNKIVNSCVKKKKVLMTTSDKIDQIVTNRWLALPIFAAIMFLVYYVSIQTVGDWTIGLIEEFFEWAGAASAEAIESAGGAEWIVSLVEDGILGGVGAVLAFVPQLMILFFFLSLLEDCGYMARVAFIMDRIFRKFGLSGKSFIPMLISSGCGVPGIMASRTIENEKDRKMTIIVTTFIPCGAKLPIIALIAGALFREAAWVAPAAYFLGVAMVIISGIILKKTSLFTGEPAPFVMELPQYHVPGAKGVFIHMWERARAFIIKAGTIIFLACAVIWFLSSFGFEGGSFGFVDVENSILAGLGGIIAPLFAPLGFGDWRAAVATISGLVAKENVVGTFGVLFGLGEVDEESVSLMTNIAGMFTMVSAMSFMIFNLLCAPCFAAIGAIKREMGGWKWTFIAIGYQTLLAYIMAFIVYQLGAVLFLGASIGIGTILAVVLIGLTLWLLFRSYNPKKESALDAEGANINA